VSGLATYVVDVDGLTADELARRVYGSERAGNTEALLKANPGLASEGLLLPRGRRVVIPDRPRPQAAPIATVNPWD
jgi:phage tail protein X